MPDPQTPRFGELLHRLLITKGYGQANVLDDYFPIIDMLSEKGELFRLRDERTFAIGGQGPGGVGTNGTVWCINQTPGQLVIIDQLVVGVFGIKQVVSCDFANNPAFFPASTTGKHSCDARYGGSNPTPPVPDAPVRLGVITLGGVATNTSVPLATCDPTSGSIALKVRYVLPPNWGLVVFGNALGAGNDVVVRFDGYARGVEDSELK